MSAAETVRERLLGVQGTVMFFLLAFTAFVVGCTRVLTGSSYNSKALNRQTLPNVPLLPYWVPFAGHFFSLFVNPSRFFEKSRCVKRTPWIRVGSNKDIAIKQPIPYFR